MTSKMARAVTFVRGKQDNQFLTITPIDTTNRIGRTVTMIKRKSITDSNNLSSSRKSLVRATSGLKKMNTKG